ncbi:MAG: hypothetical protein LC725_12570, partial [Lentisphaerae bacterium]|nr:hypothetical protein [Lentisphaerota bacterium]
PRARALYELQRLMSAGLPGSGKVKDFFVELTMIVRRYIERAHAIRAPEQTTEEFLAGVAGDTRFREEVLEKLREFLKAADLVKFAAWHPEDAAIERAVSTARDYIETE